MSRACRCAIKYQISKIRGEANFNFWKLMTLGLVVLLLGMIWWPTVKHGGMWGQHTGEQTEATGALVKPVLAADIYPEFTCSCCGQPLDKDDPCCGIMEGMIDFIGQQVAGGLSTEEVYLATVKEFGINRLTREEKREEIRQTLEERAPEDAAKLVLSEDFRDLGEVSQANGVVKTDFKLSNQGKSDLVIDHLSSSCGCTSGAIVYQGVEGPKFTMPGHGQENPTDWEVVIPPGEKAILRVYYDPNVHKDLTGVVTRIVSVFSNDPVDWEKQVTITFNQVS